MTDSVVALPLVQPVQVPKASDILASQLREMIVSGQLTSGNSLPAERKLVEESGLSRTSVRDALRVLESEGLIETRVGRSGGSRVTLPGREAISRSIELFVRTHGVRLNSLLECRVAVEPTLAALAAERRDDQQLALMQALHEQFVAAVDNIAEYKAVNLKWHLAIAHASRNEPLMALMEATSSSMRSAMDYEHTTTPTLRQDAIKAHGAILKAIERQDPPEAKRRMANHVEAYKQVAEDMMPSPAAND